MPAASPPLPFVISVHVFWDSDVILYFIIYCLKRRLSFEGPLANTGHVKSSVKMNDECDTLPQGTEARAAAAQLSEQNAGLLEMSG